MNKTQLKRWEKLSIGLALNAYPTITDARRNRLVSEVDNFIDMVVHNHGLEGILDWDGNRGSVYVGDELSDYLWNNRYEFDSKDGSRLGNFGNMLSCCIRAGFDVAVAPSAGVIGFTAGDLRKVFKRRPPKWANDFFAEPLSTVSDCDGLWL